MTKFSSSLKLLLDMTVAQSAMQRKFDGHLGGLSLTEFIILSNLENATNGKMRRVDLADSVGLTQSGITRLLAPMEKIGLIKRDKDPTDARVSFVTLAPGGKGKLQVATENAEALAKTLLNLSTKEEIANTSSLLLKVGGIVK